MFTLQQIQLNDEEIALYDEMIAEKGKELFAAQALEDEQLQRYRSRVDVKLNPMTTVRFYVPYKKMNQEGLLDETLAALLEMKNALEKLGKGASIRRY